MVCGLTISLVRDPVILPGTVLTAHISHGTCCTSVRLLLFSKQVTASRAFPHILHGFPTYSATPCLLSQDGVCDTTAPKLPETYLWTCHAVGRDFPAVMKAGHDVGPFPSKIWVRA